MDKFCVVQVEPGICLDGAWIGVRPERARELLDGPGRLLGPPFSLLSRDVTWGDYRERTPRYLLHIDSGGGQGYDETFAAELRRLGPWLEDALFFLDHHYNAPEGDPEDDPDYGFVDEYRLAAGQLEVHRRVHDDGYALGWAADNYTTCPSFRHHIHYAMAKRQVELGPLRDFEVERALSLLDEALAFERHVPALLTKAMILAELERYDEAIAAADDALAALGPAPNWDEATPVFRGLEEHRAALYGDAYYRRGYCFLEKGEHALAERDMKCSRAANWSCEEARATEIAHAAEVTLAVIAISQGTSKSGLQHLARLCRAENGTRFSLSMAFYNRACLLVRGGARASVLGMLRAALDLQPKMAKVARRDHDLDPLRELPEFGEMLPEAVAK